MAQKQCAQCNIDIEGKFRCGSWGIVFADKDEQRKGGPKFCSHKCLEAAEKELDANWRVVGVRLIK